MDFSNKVMKQIPVNHILFETRTSLNSCSERPRQLSEKAFLTYNCGDKTLYATVMLPRWWMKTPDTVEVKVHRKNRLLLIEHEGTCVEFDLELPFSLVHHEERKPWGSELWFSGIEERGTSFVKDLHGHLLPLPVLTSLLPETLIGKGCRYHDAPVLTKLLKPLSTPRYGDLYYEVHQEKQEVYVVTRIDKEAWPTGIGRMRYGMCIRTFHDDFDSDFSAFKIQFEAALKRYEAIRTRIEDRFDLKREKCGYKPNDPVPPAEYSEWYRTLPKALVVEEQEALARLESFIGWRDVKEGDIVSVANGIPHGLQHGIEVLEFQTPVYERCILSFGQKVLTQSGFDITKGLELLTHPDHTRYSSDCLTSSKVGGLHITPICQFEGFNAKKVFLSLHSSPLPQSVPWDRSHTHGIIVVLNGDLELLRNGSPLSRYHTGDALLLNTFFHSDILLYTKGETTLLFVTAVHESHSESPL